MSPIERRKWCQQIIDPKPECQEEYPARLSHNNLARFVCGSATLYLSYAASRINPPKVTKVENERAITRFTVSPVPYSLLPVARPRSLFPILFRLSSVPIPCSLLPIPCFCQVSTTYPK
jgi:hypothetical protein